MSELEEIYDEVLEQEKEVINYIASGKTTSEIYTLTNIPPKRQREIKDRFALYAQNDMASQARVKESIAYMEEYFVKMIRDLDHVYEEAESQGDLKLQKEIIREKSNLMKTKIELMQKSGILNANGIGDQMLELEEREEAIKELIVTIAQEFPQTKRRISELLAELDGKVISHRTDQPEV